MLGALNRMTLYPLPSSQRHFFWSNYQEIPSRFLWIRMENGLLPLQRVMTSSKRCSPRLWTMAMTVVAMARVVEVDLAAVAVATARAPVAVATAEVPAAAAATEGLVAAAAAAAAAAAVAQVDPLLLAEARNVQVTVQSLSMII
jgi:hypothetical protein